MPSMVGYFAFNRCARAIPLAVLGPGPFLGFLGAESVDFEVPARPLCVLFESTGCFCRAIGGVAKCEGSSWPKT